MKRFVFALAFVAIAGCQTASLSRSDAGGAIRAVLDGQARAWNAGDLSRFMEGYDKSDRTRFASGGGVHLGWQTVFDRYRSRYGDRAAMGRLTFSDLDITLLGPDSALAFGRYRLQRDKDEPTGLFTLVFRKTPEGWRIVHDHSSAAPPP